MKNDVIDRINRFGFTVTGLDNFNRLTKTKVFRDLLPTINYYLLPGNIVAIEKRL